jgi:hypothetical protein
VRPLLLPAGRAAIRDFVLEVQTDWAYGAMRMRRQAHAVHQGAPAEAGPVEPRAACERDAVSWPKAAAVCVVIGVAVWVALLILELYLLFAVLPFFVLALLPAMALVDVCVWYEWCREKLSAAREWWRERARSGQD